MILKLVVRLCLTRKIFNCRGALLIYLSLFSVAVGEQQNPVDEIISKLYLGQTRTANELIQKLTSINAVSSSGTPIIVAIAQIPALNDLALYDEVFKRRPDCNSKDKKGMTALYFAASAGNLELVDRLIQGGADPNLDSDYGSALVGAAWNDRDAVARRLLLIQGVRVDSADREGRTALIFAVIHGDLELVRGLIQKGANPNIYETVTGNTPLIWSSRGTKELAALLLDSHADYRLPNPFTCQTIIHTAVAAENVSLVRFLLERQVNPSFTDSQGMTPLGIAISLKNAEISKLLRDTLTKNGMNVTDSGVPTANCRSERLVTYARPLKPKSPSADEQAVEFVSLAKAAVTSWELQNNIFLNPDVPEYTGRQITLFKQIVCSERANQETASKCRLLLADSAKLRDFIRKDLTETFVEKRETTTWLAAVLSDSIGIDFGRAGYTVHGQNQIECSQLPKDYSKDRALFVGTDGLLELRPGITLCLRAGSYEVLVPTKHAGLTLKFYSNDVNPTPTVSVRTISAETAQAGKMISPPVEFVSLRADGSESPVTIPLPLRDDIQIDAPKNFSTVTAVKISLKDDVGLCDKECQVALRISLVRAIAVWRLGCTRCALANLLTIQFADVSYFNVQTVDVLTGYLSANQAWPAGNARTPFTGAAIFSGYEQFDRDDPRILRLCNAHIPNPYAQLCGIPAQSKPLEIVLDISKNSSTCLTPNAIACASPDGVIQLRAFDHVFATSEPLKRQTVRFGSGTQEFNLLAVLIHELGHFFGLPHLDEAIPMVDGKSDVMLQSYNPKGFWVTKADYAMLNKAVDPKWPYRLTGCAGLRH